MPKYVALLRAINVSGQNLIKMAELSKTLEKLGLENVQTYLQSGNIIFESKQKMADKLAKNISGKILKDFKLTVPTLVLSMKDIESALEKNPYKKEAVAELYITFLGSKPNLEGEEKLTKLKTAHERFKIIEQRVYLHCPKGYGKTKLSNNAIEKALGVTATTRSLKTVVALFSI